MAIKRPMKKVIDIFSLEFIDNAESIDRVSETEYTLYTKGLTHKLHYKLHINNFEICVDVRIDDLSWIYNNTMEKIHRDAFIHLSLFCFDFQQKDMEDKNESVCNWLGL